MGFYEWFILTGMSSGVIVGAIQYQRLPHSMRYLFYLFCCSLILEIAADYRMLVHQRNNLVYYHVMTVIQYTFLSLLLRNNISFIATKKKIFISIIGVLFCEFLLLGTVQDIYQSPSWIRLISRLLLLYWILSYLKSLLQSDNPIPLLSIPAFWVCLGLLVYFISFLQVGLMNFMIDADDQVAVFWYHFSLWFDALFYLICTYSLWLASKQTAQKLQYD